MSNDMPRPMMTREAIRAARERAEKATPGRFALGLDLSVNKPAVVRLPIEDPDCWFASFAHQVDAAFHVAARTDVPALCDTAEAYHDLVERVEKFCDENSGYVQWTGISKLRALLPGATP